MHCYNTLIHLHCQEGKLDDALVLLDIMDEDGLENDECTFSVLVNGLQVISGLCSAGLK